MLGLNESGAIKECKTLCSCIAWFNCIITEHNYDYEEACLVEWLEDESFRTMPVSATKDTHKGKFTVGMQTEMRYPVKGKQSK